MMMILLTTVAAASLAAVAFTIALTPKKQPVPVKATSVRKDT
jgi:hypothetical protein